MAAPATKKHQSGNEAPTFLGRSTTATTETTATHPTPIESNDTDDLSPLANPLDFVSQRLSTGSGGSVCPPQSATLPAVPSSSPSLSRVSSFSDTTHSNTSTGGSNVPTFETFASSLGLTHTDTYALDEPLRLIDHSYDSNLSDAELVAALHSLNLLADDENDALHQSPSDFNQTQPQSHPQPLELPDGSHELPELELPVFLGTELDSPLSELLNDDQLWNVFDESVASSTSATGTLTPLHGDDTAVAILQQLEGLTLKPTTYTGNDNDDDNDDETQSLPAWLEEQPLYNPWHLDPNMTMLPQPRPRVPRDQPSTDDLLYCQPCNDPQSIPPPDLHSYSYLSSEETRLIQQVEDAEYWQQQWRVLTSGGMPSSLTNTALIPNQVTNNIYQNDEHYFCQPCDDPNSIPPPTYSDLLPYMSEEQTWALAANAVFAEQWEHERQTTAEDHRNEDYIWSQPLPDDAGDLHLQPDPFDVWQDHGRGEEMLPTGGLEPDTALEDVMVPVSESTGSTHALNTPHLDETDRNPTSIRPGARAAAEPLVEAFGANFCRMTDPHDATAAKPQKQPPHRAQRECFGHKERILGCDVSHCGRFLATASQDSTICIWSIATHRELAVLRGHSTEHECLRVAWASSLWAQDQIQRTGTAGSGADDPQRPTYAFIVASGGADGVVHLWGCNHPETEQWSIYATVDHTAHKHFIARSTSVLGGMKSADGTETTEPPLDDDRPQIYSLQFIDHWQGLPSRSKLSGGECGGEEGDKTTNYSNSFLLTSSDEYVHLWELDDLQLSKKTKTATGAVSKQLHLREVLSLRFGHLDDPAYGVSVSPVTEECSFVRNELSPPHPALTGDASTLATENSFRFGGERNVKNVIFVFDASYCTTNGLLGVALSDGSLRLMNGRCICLSVLQLPGCQSHLTSFSWDLKGEMLATTVATGHLITWGIQLIHHTHTSTLSVASKGDDHGSTVGGTAAGIRASCRAVMEGGHVRGRPLYGSRFIGNDLLLSWGSDGRVCLWDSQACDDEVDEPLAVLWDNNGYKGGSDEGYPVFAVSLTHTQMGEHEVSLEASPSSDPVKPTGTLSIAIAGGGSESGFLGIPAYLQDVTGLPSDDDDEFAQGSTKRPKQEEDEQ